MSTALLKPTLYATGESGVVLLGGQCECGYTFFPMQSYGCEQCGRDGGALRPKSLRGSGKLITAAVVHLHADKRRPAPFAVGTIALDDGPTVRTLLSNTELANRLQTRVQAELISIAQEDGTQLLDLRFTGAGT